MMRSITALRSVPTVRRTARAALLGVLALVLPACASEATARLVLPPGTEAALAVEGSNPWVIVENDGPGSVEVTFKSPGWPPADPIRIDQAASGRTLPGGGNVRIANDSTQDAAIKILMKHQKRFRLDHAHSGSPTMQ